MRVSHEKLKTWAETLEALQSKLPSDISYYRLESYGEIRQYINSLLKQAERETGPGHG